MSPRAERGILVLACATGVAVTARSLRGGIHFWPLSSEYPPNAAHDAAHREDAFVIRKKYFANAVATIVPAFEQREVFHGFEREPAFRRRERIENRLHPRFHRLGFCMLGRLDRKRVV